MQYAPPPTEEQLARVRERIGASSLSLSHRIEGGLGCTLDVLVDNGSRLVLRRYGPWYAERGEDAAARETRALEILQKARVPAPAPIWLDSEGVFEEQAVIISHESGAPDLTPAHPFEWAEQLALTLASIHRVAIDEDDLGLFPPGAGEDERRISEHPELVLEHPLGEDLLRRRVMLGAQRTHSDPVFSHTDFWPGNTLWSEGQLVSVIDWESPAMGDREMDLAYCSMDIRYLGMDKVADRLIETYKEETGTTLSNLAHWESVALCRPMPDIATWVPAWVSMGRDVTEDKARGRHTEVIEDFLARTS